MLKFVHRPSKSYNPDLKNFHVKFIKVLDAQAKNSAIAGRDKKPGAFWSNFKRNAVVVKANFQYEDYNNADGFTYDSLALHDRIDLIKNDQERVRCKTPFVQKWKKQAETSEKFKIYQGLFTATANQPFSSRLLDGKIEALKKIITKRVRTGRKSPEVRPLYNLSRGLLVTTAKSIGRTKFIAQDINSPEVADKEIGYFEKELAYIPERKRWCYDF